MMCSDARGAMPTAERAELRAEGDGGLAMHLRGCDACRAVAIRLEAGTELLAAMVGVRVTDPMLAHRRYSSSARRRRVAAFVLVPIAAAAAVVAMVRRETPASVPRAQRDHSVATSVAVEVPRGQTATVIRTANPNVTIVWLTPGGTE